MQILAHEQRSVTAPNGQPYFGEITEEIGSEIGFPTGKVHLLNGFEGHHSAGFGRAHMLAKPERMRMLSGLGFRSLEQYVWHVTRDYDRILQGANNRLILLREHKGYQLHLMIEWRQERGFWSIITGLPKRTQQEKRHFGRKYGLIGANHDQALPEAPALRP